MKIVRRLLLLLILAGLGLWVWKILFPSPEKVIRKKLAAVAHVASFTANESPLTAAHHATQLAGHFSLDAEVILHTAFTAYAFHSREEIREAALAARSNLRGLTVEFFDAAIMVEPDRTSATVDITVKARVPGEREFYVQEMKFALKKINGDWLITRIETVKTLSQLSTYCAPLAAP